jgi:transcription-repair coupling factor (superfamily II helicase)
MHLTGLLDALSSTDTFTTLVQGWREHTERLPDQGVLRSARPFVIATLAQQLQIPTVVVTAKIDRAYDVSEQILAWLPDANVLRFQEPSAMFYDRGAWGEQTIRSRIQTLAALVPPIPTRSGPKLPHYAPPILVTSAYALMQKTLPVREFRVGSRQLHVGQVIDPDKLIHQWVDVGYQSASVVTVPGTFSRRGGIVDVFAPAMDVPVRIEFFGDEVDSLRTFDPATQRSIESIETCITTPAREALPKMMPALAERLQEWFRTQPDEENDATSALPDVANLDSGMIFPTAEFYLPWLYSAAASLFDYLPEEALVLVEDWGALRDTVAELESQALEVRDTRLSTNELPPIETVAYHTWDDIQETLNEWKPLHLGHYDGSMLDDAEAINIPVLGDLFTPGARYGGQLRLFLDQLQNLSREEEKAIVVTRQAQRVAELWGERKTFIQPYEAIDDWKPLEPVTFVEGELAEGWSLRRDDVEKIHLVTDAEIFGWKRPEPRRRVQKRSVSPEAHFADLDEGDFVVHVDYGIGRFQGIVRRKLQDSEREYLKVEYARNDVLYVPIHQADRLTSYVGVQNRPPTLSRLGNQDWSTTKKRTQEAVQEVAEELLALYAARGVVTGHAFSPDSPWQHELEASFPYVETEDQLRALQDVKADMEAPKPMDRLICGDVGYGKTEVALRAAFKAVMDGKQVAILVPTTVLAQQHFTTFSQRLVAFPVKVEMLSRFRTRAEQDIILEDTEAGSVDIVIGTHRLLQEDVKFKNLGLVVVDEEQRFGVTHKERLKRMRTEVDVLTMTATPIPRTLYMGLTGLRDISLIQTPPEERLPVVNHVGVYDENIVRQAILREIDRGGQVFFVHNRVQTIESVTYKLRKLVPEASFVIGHGQMNEHELEEVMATFARGEHDVLACTTIIENGMDIPSANTIIIDRADTFGLSQLYQLRGRVGRSSNQAYVYFFHSRDQILTSDARARLDTINEYTELGSGMSIAVRDLEIRGMGDLLGVHQSGYIDSVGFHLYTQLLTQTVHDIQGSKLPSILQLESSPETTVSAQSITIDLPLPAYLPTDFIEDMSLRIQLYRRLANIATVADLDALEAELLDRFGKLPKAVQGLTYQIRVKLLAQLASATAIATENGRIHVRLPYLGSIDRMALQNYLGDAVRVSRTAIWLPTDLSDEQWQPMLVELLHNLKRESFSPMFKE